MNEIRNKVDESGLIQLDLAQFKPHMELKGVDIAAQLWQGSPAHLGRARRRTKSGQAGGALEQGAGNRRWGVVGHRRASVVLRRPRVLGIVTCLYNLSLPPGRQ